MLQYSIMELKYSTNRTVTGSVTLFKSSVVKVDMSMDTFFFTYINLRESLTLFMKFLSSSLIILREFTS